MVTSAHLGDGSPGRSEPADQFDAVQRVADLERALESRDIIGQAKGILMERHQIDSGEAFDLLRAMSQHRNERLRGVAQKIVEGRESWGSHAPERQGEQEGGSAHDVAIAVSGELDLARAPALLEEIRASLNGPIATLTLDLGDVSFIDSSGLHALNQVRLLTADRDIPFALAAVPRCAQRVLDITNMDGLFTYR